MPSTRNIGGLVPNSLLRRTPIETFFLRGWPGGWQPGIPQSQLTPDSIPDLLNVQYGIAGSIEKRKGFTIVTDTNPDAAGDHLWLHQTNAVIGSPTLVDPSQVAVYSTEADGSIWYQTVAELLASPNTDLVDSTSSMGSVKGIASNLNPEEEYVLQSFVFEDIIYITGHRFGGDDAGAYTLSTEDATSTGATKPLKFGIVAGTWSRATVPNLTAAGSQTGTPRSTAVCVLHDRVFYANVASQDVYDFGNRVYWSEPGTAETIESNNYVTVGSDDGTQIRKLQPLGSQIIIFKEEGIWSMVGTDEDTFALYNLTQKYGSHAPHAVATYQNKLYFLDSYAGVMSYDGAEFENISTPINIELLADLNRSLIYKSVMYVDDADDKLYMSIVTGSSGTLTQNPGRTYVYDFLLRAWTKWDYGFSAAARVNATFSASAPVATDGPIWTVNNDSTIGIFEINDSYGDNGVAYDCYFQTAWFNPGEVGDVHRIRRIEILTDPDGDDIVADVYRNFYDTAVWSTATFNPAGALDQWHEQDQEHDIGLWTWIKFKFTNNTLNEFFHVNGVGLTYSDRKLLRGKRTGLNAVNSGGSL